jgi:hypothetical protein
MAAVLELPDEVFSRFPLDAKASLFLAVAEKIFTGWSTIGHSVAGEMTQYVALGVPRADSMARQVIDRLCRDRVYAKGYEIPLLFETYDLMVNRMVFGEWYPIPGFSGWEICFVGLNQAILFQLMQGNVVQETRCPRRLEVPEAKDAKKKSRYQNVSLGGSIKIHILVCSCFHLRPAGCEMVHHKRFDTNINTWSCLAFVPAQLNGQDKKNPRYFEEGELPNRGHMMIYQDPEQGLEFWDDTEAKKVYQMIPMGTGRRFLLIHEY